MYKILIVDDMPINIKLVRAILEREVGYEVISAINGNEALQKVKECSPDLILLDAMMPDIDGVEVARIIRENNTNLDMPIIMLTASSVHNLKIEALIAGVDEFLNKPIDKVELVTRIKTLLKNKSLHKELQLRHSEIMRQMDLAKIVQFKLQSTELLEYQSITVEPSYFPMFQIGGDIIYVKQIENGNTVLFLGDAAGHGISAALVGTLVKAILESLPNINDAGLGLTYINKKLSMYFDSNLDDIYVTCVMCIIHHDKKTISIANAGHPLPLSKHFGEDIYKAIEIISGLPIGIMGQVNYTSSEIEFDSLEEILLYTDGIFPMIGYENMEILEKSFTSEMLSEIITKRKLTLEEEQQDDFAIIRVRFKK